MCFKVDARFFFKGRVVTQPQLLGILEAGTLAFSTLVSRDL
jgi:hypothetical protein